MRKKGRNPTKDQLSNEWVVLYEKIVTGLGSARTLRNINDTLL